MEGKNATLAVGLLGAVIYGTRTMFPPVMTMIQKELHWEKEELAYVLSCFAFGYLWLQIIAGMVTQRYGARLLMACCCAAELAGRGAGQPKGVLRTLTRHIQPPWPARESTGKSRQCPAL